MMAFSAFMIETFSSPESNCFATELARRPRISPFASITVIFVTSAENPDTGPFWICFHDLFETQALAAGFSDLFNCRFAECYSRNCNRMIKKTCTQNLTRDKQNIIFSSVPVDLAYIHSRIVSGRRLKTFRNILPDRGRIYICPIFQGKNQGNDSWICFSCKFYQ